MSDSPVYAHGYDPVEQARLVAQAQYWQAMIVDGVAYPAGARVLEIGCGVGAVLGVIARHCLGVKLAGIDIEERQITSAKRHLESIGLCDIELRTGDARQLPWDDGTFDQVYAIWLIEHFHDPLPVLREALRVLKPGGSIRLIETDYSSLQIGTESDDYQRFIRAFVRCFHRHGDGVAGRRLGRHLEAAGFVGVRNQLFGYNYWNDTSAAELRAHIEYLDGFMGPMLDEVAAMDADPDAVRRGYAALQDEWRQPAGLVSHSFYRATAIKSSN